MYLKQIKVLFFKPKFRRIFLIGSQILSILKHLHLQTPRVKLERKHFSLSARPRCYIYKCYILPTVKTRLEVNQSLFEAALRACKEKKHNFPYCKVSSLRYNAVRDNFKTAFICQGHSAVRSTR